MTDDQKPADADTGLNNDPATDRRNAEAPETFNDSQRREDEQAQSVAEDALAQRRQNRSPDQPDE
ncbi:MAG: hypothetical protein GW859_04660 [Sphingomonadales bacterium]|nr:hypothetical protein [Sphingomonadales bacterium]